MQRLFRLLPLFLSFVHLHASDEMWTQPGAPLAEVVGAPSAFAGPVNTITGNYCEVDVDVVQDGPTPLAWKRSYTSSPRHYAEVVGWRDNHPYSAGCKDGLSEDRIDTSRRNEYKNVSICRPDGAVQSFRLFNNMRARPAIKTNDIGITNLSSSISARTNFKNSRTFAGKTKYELCYSHEDGTIFNYVDVKGNGTGYLRDVIHPNQAQFLYCISKNGGFKGISAVSSGGTEYAGIRFQNPSRNRKDRTSKVYWTLHDGRKISYEWDIKKGYTNGINLALRKVERVAGPPIEYEYARGKGIRTLQMTAKHFPEGRSLYTEYYERGDNELCGGNIFVNSKDIRVSKVRRQLVPSGPDGQLIAIRQFDYHESRDKRERPQGGWTNVFDPYGNFLQYHYDKRERLYLRVHLDHNKAVYLQEHLNWSNEKKYYGNLMRYSVQDGHRNIYKQIDYTYDLKGNILEEGFFHAVDGHDEKHYEEDITRYSYYPNNLLKAEFYSNGRTVRYWYHGTTDLIERKLIEEEGRIIQREFFDYNEHNLVIRHEVDNGSSSNRDDKTGVNVQRYTQITPCLSATAFGKPLVIDECYMEEGVEHLITRKERSYDHYGYLAKEILYDAAGVQHGTRQWQYDERGRLLQEIDPYGSITRYHHDANDNVILIEGPRLGQRVRREYDKMNRLTTETISRYGQEWTVSHQYDYLGRRTVETNIHGQETRYCYDAAGNVTQITHPAQPLNGDLISAVEHSKYDGIGNKVYYQDPKGYVETALYNGRNQPLWKQNRDKTAEVFSYSTMGDLLSHRQKDETFHEYVRDSMGRVLEERHLDAEGQFISCTAYKYDGFSLLSSTDAAGNITRYEYDGAGRLIATVSPTTTVRFTYDALGRKSRTIYPDRIEIEELDYLDRVVETRIEDHDGKVWQRKQMQYDAVGNIISSTTYGLRGPETVTTEYDGLNRAIRTVDTMGHVSTTEYDDQYVNSWGQTVQRVTDTDPLGRQTITEYDARGRVYQIERFDEKGALSASEIIEYDLNGNKARNAHAVLAEGSHYRSYEILWEYGPENRLEETVDNHLRTTRYSYDKNGRLYETILPDGNIIYRLYDHAGRLYEHYSEDGTVFHRYQYDQRGQVVQVDDLVNDTHTLRCYDADGRIVEEQLANGHTVIQEYNAAGKVSAVVIEGERIDYQHNPAGYEKVSWRDKTYGYLERDQSGRLLKAQGAFPSRYTYDSQGQLIGMESPHYLFRTGSGYDACGRLLTYTEAYGDQKIQGAYVYDSLDQLTQEHGWTHHNYHYDSLNSRIGIDGRVEDVDDLNQLLDDEQEQYEYDDVGRLIAKVQADVQYHYDAFGRLLRATKSDHSEIAFTYDPFHRCMSRTVITTDDETVDTYLYWDKCELGMIRDGQLRQFRVLGEGSGAEIGAALFMLWDGKTYDVVHDFHANIVGLIDSKNKLQHLQRYSAFGESTQSTQLPWGFSSKRHDHDLGLLNFGRRYYDPTTARWTTPDPAGYADGPNLYAYVKNSPISNFDLWGLECCPTLGENYYGHERISGTEGTIKPCLHYSEEQQVAHVNSRIDKGVPYVMWVGDKVAFEDLDLVFVHGIDTSPKLAREVAQLMSNIFDRQRVLLVGYRCINGGHDVLANCISNKFGIDSIASKTLAAACTDLHNDRGGVGRTLLFCHSNGGNTMYNAIPYMETEVMQGIDVRNYGGSTSIPLKDFHESVNYWTLPDPIPCCQYFGVGRISLFSENEGYKFEYIKPKSIWGSLFSGCNHGILDDPYLGKVQEVAAKYKDKWPRRQENIGKNK